jgi:hypothetical protein
VARDPIDQAIATSESQSRETRVRMDPTLPSGRVAIIDLPSEMSVDDFRALVGWLVVDMPRTMAEARASEAQEAPVDITARRRVGRLIVPS